ncbi:MAG: TonB-dependent receptor, partial [Proteobacteria bacterium]|nr:TonB-dependent receptor [Pseudomonadota bacterium]
MRLVNAIRLAMGAGLAVAFIGGPQAVAAQEDEAAQLERVQVTGSRIQRTDIETSTPVYVMSNEDIKAGGYQRVEDILNSLPQVEAAQTAFVSNGSTLTASVDLRGLGPARTLVLFNGRRMPPGGVNTSAPDINQIPAAMIERVEILTGGGSSVYGADAVAGVINFILRKDFEGIEISANWSAYQHDNSNSYMQGLMDAAGYEYETGNSGFDGDATSLSVVLGGQFADGRGHATGYIDYRSVDAMLQGERDYSSCALNAAGTACGGSGTAPNPNFFISPINAIDPETGELVPNFEEELFLTLGTDSSLVASEGNLYNFAPINFFQRPDERYAMGAFLSYEFNQNVRPYMEVNFMHDRSVAQIAESGTFFAEQYDISLENRDVFSAAQALQLQSFFGIGPTDDVAVFVGKRNVEGGGRQSIGDHSAYRFVVGSEGDLGMNWAYDASYMYSAVASSQASVNDFFLPRVRQGIGVDQDCGGGCVPYEVFTYNGISEQAAAYAQATGVLNGMSSQEVINAYVTGDLPFTFPSASLPLAAVFGVEHREETFERVADEVFANALLAGLGGPTPSVSGSYDVSEFFTELSIPVLDSLTLDLGARYSDYSNFGGESTYKLAVDWTPISELKIRGAYNRAIRAPNNQELYTPQGLGLWGGVDPCAGATPYASDRPPASIGWVPPCQPAARISASSKGQCTRSTHGTASAGASTRVVAT